MIGLNQCPSLPTCISNSVILLCNPRSCCCRAVFSPLREVICCWIRLFSAFWKLKWRFLHKLHFTFLPRCGPARSTSSSSRRQSSSSALIPGCPSRCVGSELLFCGCWARSRCSWFVAEWGSKYLESLQLALQGGRVRAEAVTGLVHSINISINLSYLFDLPLPFKSIP